MDKIKKFFKNALGCPELFKKNPKLGIFIAVVAIVLILALLKG